MNKDKILRYLHGAVNLLALASLFTGSLSPKYALIALTISGALKEFLIEVGDVLDDGERNGSFVNVGKNVARVAGAILATVTLCGLVGCASQSYVAADGTRYSSQAVFMKGKEAAKVSPKTGFSQSGEGAVDSDGLNGFANLLKTVFDLGAKAGTDAAKAAK